MNLEQQAMKGIIWSAIESWGRQVMGAGIFFLLARLLGPESYGLVALSWVFLAFVNIFVDQGFAKAIVQRSNLEAEHLDTAFWTNFGVGILLMIFSIASSQAVAAFFHEPRVAPIICWLSINFVLTSLSNVQQSILQRRLEFKALAIRSLAAVIAGGVVGITMALLGYGAWSLVGQQLVNGAVQFVILWWVTDWRPQLRFSKKHFDDLWKFGINLVGFELINFANIRADDLLVGYFLGSTALGYYSFAHRILFVMTEMLTNVMVKVAMPIFSRLQEDMERLRQVFYRAVRLSALICFPIFLGLAALAPELIRVLFGDRWLPSAPVLQALAFVGLIRSVFFFNGTLILAIGKPFWQLVMTSVNAVANLLAFSLSVRWGILAVAISFAIRAYVVAPFDIWVMCNLVHIHLKTYFRQYIGSLSSAIFMISGILLLKQFAVHHLEPKFALMVLIPLGAFLYIVPLKLLAPKLFREFIELVKLPIAAKLENRS